MVDVAPDEVDGIKEPLIEDMAQLLEIPEGELHYLVVDDENGPNSKQSFISLKGGGVFFWKLFFFVEKKQFFVSYNIQGLKYHMIIILLRTF